MGLERSVPEECHRFCLEQYHRYKIPMPRCIDTIIRLGAGVSMRYVDYIDPYVLLRNGLSDVEMTDDWHKHAYIVNDGTGNLYEPSPEGIESYGAVPNQADETFHKMMSFPGLDALPYGIGSELKGLINGVSDYCYQEEVPVWDELTAQELEELNRMCLFPNGGGVSSLKFEAYFELAAWAAFAWIVGPLSREFRATHHDIMSVAMTNGECILLDGCVISPVHYRKLERPPNSCYMCGIVSWCVEMTMAGEATNHMCEHCLSEGMPKLTKFATCGSKMCMVAECPHNPYHNLGSAGIHKARSEHGQLGAMARGESVMKVMGETNKQLKG